jgi:hypothetical protein
MDREIESTQSSGFGRLQRKKYSYWLSCIYITLTIPPILPKPGSDLGTRQLMIITGMARKFITAKKYKERDMPKREEHEWNAEGMKRR